MEDATLAAPSRPHSFALPLHRAWLTQVILVLNVLLFLLLSAAAQTGFMPALLGGADGSTLILFGAKSNLGIKQGEFWRLLTPLFLHIGITHLLFNQYALFSFGKEVESLFGTARFAIIYLLSGLFGSLASFAFVPAISAGASGAIFGIIGTLAAFFLRNRELFGERGGQQLRSLLGLIGVNLFLGISIPGIDNWGHMGGLVTGFVLGWVLAPTYLLQAIPQPPFGRVVERRAALPPLLVALFGLALLAAGLWLALPLAPLPTR